MERNKYEIKTRYATERKKLASLVDAEVWDLFNLAGVYIAGGAVTSIFTNSEVNDLDVYFKSEEQLVKVVAAIYSMPTFHDYEIDISQFSLIYNGKSERTLMFSKDGQEYQFMTFKYFSSPQEVFNTFDFTVCMGLFDCGKQEFVFHQDFFQHLSQRYLKFNPKTDYPIMSLLRVGKYQDKGFTISKTELLRVVFTCMNLGMNSWEDVKNHIGGMYGYDMSDIFDEDEEFSFEELTYQLNNIHEADIKKFCDNSSDTDFFSVLESFCEKPEEMVKEESEEPHQFDDSKYLYKCVNDDWTSPFRSFRSGGVRYLEGSILDTEKLGKLFFHTSSDNPYHSSPYWVEAELIDGEVEDVTGKEKIAVSGKIRVVRNFVIPSCGAHSIQNIRTKYEWLFDKYEIVSGD